MSRSAAGGEAGQLGAFARFGLLVEIDVIPPRYLPAGEVTVPRRRMFRWTRERRNLR